MLLVIIKKYRFLYSAKELIGKERETMENVKRICGKTRNLTGEDGRYFQLNYHVMEDAVFVDEFTDPTHKMKRDHNDNNVIECGCIYTPMKMTEIEQMVQNELAIRNIDIAKIKRRL